MPASLNVPEVQEFRLEELDARQGIPEGEATKVSIKQARVRENSARADLFAELVIEDSDEKHERPRRIINLPLYSLAQKEVFLTLVGCNMTTANGKEPLFRFKNGPQGQYLDMTESQFAAAWGLLDDETASEIHSKVLEVNYHWLLSADLQPLGE